MATDSEQLHVTINGESHSLSSPLTVDALLANLGIDQRQVAVERNREIVPKTAYPNTALSDGDELEIVTFVGGG